MLLPWKHPVGRARQEGHAAGAFNIDNKKIEWQDYRAQVTTYELERYLPVL